MPPLPSLPLRVLALWALYLAGCLFADALVRGGGTVTLFWPAAGVGLALVMRYGPWAALIVPAAILPFHLLFSPVPAAFLPFSLAANGLGALAGGLVARHQQHEQALDLRTMTAMLLGGALLAIVSSVIGAIGMAKAGMIPAGAGEPWQAGVRWLLGNFLGVVAVTPSLLLATEPNRRPPAVGLTPYAEESERLAWLMLMATGYLLMAWGASFGGDYALGLTTMPLALLAWAALRFPPRWTVIASLATILLIGLLAGVGLEGFAPPQRLLDNATLLAYLCLLALLPLLLAITVHERRGASDRLVRRTTTDAVSGLPNRQAFEQHVGAALAMPEPPPRALAYLDLDHLKLINDTASHAAGDAYIHGIGGLLRASLPPGDLLAHLGGDEFGLLFQNCVPAVAEDRARALLRAVASYRCAWHGDALATTASIGLVPFHTADVAYGTLLSQADAACFTAKESGGNRVCLAGLHGGDLLDRTQAMHWAMRLRKAVRHQDLGLYCQVIQPLNTDAASAEQGHHFELLLRVRDPASGELLLPDRFLSAAERFGMSVSIDRAVVSTALGWMEEHADPARIGTCCLNLSAGAMVDEEFIAFLVERLRRSTFPADKLCLEITETSAMRDLARAQRFIGQMRDLGCRFALDDFGTGFCSFSHLHTLDVDYFKIDGSFVRTLLESPLSQSIVRAINDIAHVLDKRTIAEQVESQEMLEALALLQVDYAQGYVVHRPEPIERFFASADS